MALLSHSDCYIYRFSKKNLTEKSEKTHRRILDAASQSFKCNGFSGVGVYTIAQAAGVTTGALYAHFGSKDGLFEAVIQKGLEDSLRLIRLYQQETGKKWPKVYAEFYLAAPHRVDVAGGCAMAALSPEICRAAPEHRIAYEFQMMQIVDEVSAGLAKGSEKERRARAWAFLGTLTGGLTLARAARTPIMAEEIAAVCRETALAAAGKGVKIKHAFMLDRAD